MNITRERALALLRCDFSTGEVVLLKNNRIVKPCGSGYGIVHLDGKKYQAHRIIWLCAYGYHPPELIDHINGVKADNRLSNLRLASSAINSQNLRKSRIDSSTGVIGVGIRRGRYSATIKIAGKNVHLGLYDSVAEAALAYVNAKRIHHKGCTL